MQNAECRTERNVRDAAHSAIGNQQSAIVIGGGLAGLAAASELGRRGLAVTLLESRNRLGGRASSFVDAATGQMIDACQHVTMGCCTNFAHFCKTVGIDHFVERQPTLWFMTPDRRISRFGVDPLPAPLHLARSLLRAHYLTFGDKLRIAWGMVALLRAHADDDVPLLPWLKRNRQNDRTIERFWAVVLTSALNESINRLGLKYARKVFVDGFLTHREGFEVWLPTVPLARLYGEELQDYLAGQGVRLEVSAGVKRVQIGRGSRFASGIELRDGRTLTADWYISAVPFAGLLGLLPAEVVDEHAEFSKLREFTVSPITSVHLWYDRPIVNLPHVVLVDCLGQWIFNRGRTGAHEYYVQIVVSAARLLRSWGHEETRRRIVNEMNSLFPAGGAAKLLRSRVVTETAATFSAHPGVDRLRPGPISPIGNLFLAGDWTATGWPATMEGAVRSGYRAAEELLARIGGPETLVQPDLR